MRAVGLGVLILIAGCATAPENVKPAAVDSAPYMAMECPQLTAEKQRLDLAVAQMALQQEKTRSADTAGVLLLFMPLGRMSGGDHEGELATLKGQDLAVDQVRTAKACT